MNASCLVLNGMERELLKVLAAFELTATVVSVHLPMSCIRHINVGVIGVVICYVAYERVVGDMVVFFPHVSVSTNAIHLSHLLTVVVFASLLLLSSHVSYSTFFQ